MVLGCIVLPLPVAIQVAVDPQFGLLWHIYNGDVNFDSVACFVMAGLLLFIFWGSFYWLTPNMIRKVYVAKKSALAESTKEVLLLQIKQQMKQQSQAQEPSQEKTGDKL
jgi:Zn-dependent protease with chaperone function